MNRLIRKRKGFTLIELIVVIAILGILAAILIPQFSGFQDRATRTQVITDGKQIATAVESLLVDGTITAASTTAALTNTAGVPDDLVIRLSGVPLNRITSLVYENDGGFTLTSTVTNRAGTAFVASRTSSSAAVGVAP